MINLSTVNTDPLKRARRPTKYLVPKGTPVTYTTFQTDKGTRHVVQYECCEGVFEATKETK